MYFYAILVKVWLIIYFHGTLSKNNLEKSSFLYSLAFQYRTKYPFL